MKNMLKASALRATPICAALICAAMCASALAQSTTPSSSSSSSSADSDQPQSAPAGATANPVAQPSRIAPGTVIKVELTKTIDAKKAKTGDEVVAKVSQDLKTPSGEILVPKDSKIVGHVTEARARTKDQKDSEVAIAFDHAATKNGDMQLPMSIQAIIAPQNNDSADAGGGNPSYGNSPSPSMGGGGGRSPMSGGSSPAPQPQSPSNMQLGNGTVRGQRASSHHRQHSGSHRDVGCEARGERGKCPGISGQLGEEQRQTGERHNHAATCEPVRGGIS